MKTTRRVSKGQTATEYLLILSVIVVAAVMTGHRFVPMFAEGSEALGRTVSQILGDGSWRGDASR